MTVLRNFVDHEPRKRFAPEVRKNVLDLLARGQRPIDVERQTGIPRETIKTWRKRAQAQQGLNPPVSSSRGISAPRSVKPLQVIVPAVKQATLSIPPGSDLLVPCPVEDGCTTMLISFTSPMPDPEVESWFMAHYEGSHQKLQNEPRTTRSIQTGTSKGLVSPEPQNALRTTWYECDQCSQQFEYLRRGGTCNRCRASLGED